MSGIRVRLQVFLKVNFTQATSVESDAAPGPHGARRLLRNRIIVIVVAVAVAVAVDQRVLDQPVNLIRRINSSAAGSPAGLALCFARSLAANATCAA